jgi:hypothetical protein
VTEKSKASLRESFDATRAHAEEQAFEIFFSAPTRNLSAKFAHPAHADAREGTWAQVCECAQRYLCVCVPHQ